MQKCQKMVFCFLIRGLVEIYRDQIEMNHRKCDALQQNLDKVAGPNWGTARNVRWDRPNQQKLFQVL